MTSPPPSPPPSPGIGRAGWLIPAAAAALALAYAGGHLGWYRDTPLGQHPVVDEQENLVLAEAITRGQLPREPFYRAMGYPLLLAVLRGLGVAAPGLFGAALTAGVLLHAINAGLLARIAFAWFGRGGAIAAGALGALHPVFVHYSTQALDAAPALTFFLLGFACLANEFTGRPPRPARPWCWAIASLAWAAATMLRPNYLTVWLVLPVMGFRIHQGFARWRPMAAACSGVAVFALVAGWQWHVSGTAGFLPWQGSYNLWAANQPGAHGRYFVQRVNIPSSVATLNTTRAESIYLYRQETGAAPADVAALNTHWRRRFFQHLGEHPVAWLRQSGQKVYALLNSWEQYNNKTFAFHQARSPWLRWNPISWGLLLLCAVLGAARLAAEHPAAARGVLLTALAAAAGVLLFFVSARFRLPLAALATLLAAGALASPLCWRAWSRRRQLTLALTAALGALLAFSSFGGVRDRGTFLEDHALLARAALAIGDDTQAWNHATAALALYPRHRDAQRVALSSYFNHLVRQRQPPAPESEWLEVGRRILAARDPDVRDLQAIAALALWRASDRTGAFDEWIRLGSTPSAIAARLLAGDRSLSPRDLAAQRTGWDEALVRLAAAHFHVPLPDGRPAGDPQRATEVIRALFGGSNSR